MISEKMEELMQKVDQYCDGVAGSTEKLAEHLVKLDSVNNYVCKRIQAGTDYPNLLDFMVDYGANPGFIRSLHCNDMDTVLGIANFFDRLQNNSFFNDGDKKCLDFLMGVTTHDDYKRMPQRVLRDLIGHYTIGRLRSAKTEEVRIVAARDHLYMTLRALDRKYNAEGCIFRDNYRKRIPDQVVTPDTIEESNVDTDVSVEQPTFIVNGEVDWMIFARECIQEDLPGTTTVQKVFGEKHNNKIFFADPSLTCKLEDLVLLIIKKLDPDFKARKDNLVAYYLKGDQLEGVELPDCYYYEYPAKYIPIIRMIVKKFVLEHNPMIAGYPKQ